MFLAFLKLGLTSFGGPVAHLGYFRAEFVERRAWLDDKSYSDLVALCQFLPGPASSQVGIALGLGRAGWLGALCAWAGFTLPSAIALILFAFGIAIVATLLVLAVPSAMGQVGAIVAGGLAGRWAVQLGHLPVAQHRDYGVRKRTGAAMLLLLVLLPVLAAAVRSPALSVISSFYQSGALVFGGGHVVLPLLQMSVVPNGLVTNDAFLAGYGAACAGRGACSRRGLAARVVSPSRLRPPTG